ncbi:MAG: hypothetical protein ABIJ96_16735 [Elusimicrobiota bacterium]
MVLFRYCLLVTFFVAVAAPAQAQTYSWDIDGSLTDDSGHRLTGNYLLNFSLSRCQDHPDKSWRLFRYIRVTKGDYSLRIGTDDFLPESAAPPQRCHLQIAAPAGAPWRVNGVSIRRHVLAKNDNRAHRAEMERLRAAVERDSADDPFRDALNSTLDPRARKKALRLRRINSREAKLLDRRLKSAMRKH